MEQVWHLSHDSWSHPLQLLLTVHGYLFGTGWQLSMAQVQGLLMAFQHRKKRLLKKNISSHPFRQLIITSFSRFRTPCHSGFAKSAVNPDARLAKINAAMLKWLGVKRCQKYQALPARTIRCRMPLSYRIAREVQVYHSQASAF